MDSISTPAIEELRARQIPHRVFQHPGPVTSLEQAAAERNQQPEQVVRSIVFRLSEDDFIMVLMAGPGQVPWKFLRRYTSQSRLTMATEEELLRVTGCVPGTVSPFGLPQPMRVLVDTRILEQPEVSLGSGVRGVAIMMDPQVMVKAIEGVEMISIDEAS